MIAGTATRGVRLHGARAWRQWGRRHPRRGLTPAYMEFHLCEDEFLYAGPSGLGHARQLAARQLRRIRSPVTLTHD